MESLVDFQNYGANSKTIVPFDSIVALILKISIRTELTLDGQFFVGRIKAML